MTKVLLVLIAGAVFLHGLAPAAGQLPLPEPDAFFEAVRLNLVRSQREQNRYAYKERRTDIHTNPFGRLGTGGTRVVEVVPQPDGLTATRRLLARDDKPVTAGEVEKFNLPRRNPNGSRNIDDIVRTLAFTIGGREMSGGQAFITINFEPRPDARPSTRQGRLAKVFKGTVWVNEALQEVERLEATAIDNLSFGLGFVARVRKGATVSAERKPVEGGVWMPTSLRFSGEGRAILFRKLDVDFAIDWFDYRLAGPPRSGS
jgi:hypothetical protein